jgi:O-succinylbenzoic acid--CoA ligase
MTEPRDELNDWIADRAAHIPDRIALVAENHSWSFADLDRDISRLARQLASSGVRSGDRVATILNNSAYAAILPHALLRLAATLVPLNVRLSESEIAWMISDVTPRVVIVEERTRSLAAQSHVRPIDIVQLTSVEPKDHSLRTTHHPDHVAAIIYTSGTTGKPKGAMLTVANFLWSAIGSALNLRVLETDRWIACLPLFHVGGLSIAFRSAVYGTTIVVHDGFDAAAVNAEIDRGATMVSVVSVMLQRLLDERGNKAVPPTFRCALLGGGPAPSSLVDRCERICLPVATTYGLTETCSQAATLSPEHVKKKPGSSGQALHPNEIRIDPRESNEGEILVRGPIVMAGYFNNPDATATALSGGWLHTGDIGRIDEEGFLYVLDRRDDLIVTGGENVYPAEVESALIAHPSVVEAGVIGVDDPTWGKRVVAIIRTGAEISQKDLDAHCRSMLAGYKVPREYRIVTEPLPRTASGKIRRALLRDVKA